MNTDIYQNTAPYPNLTEIWQRLKAEHEAEFTVPVTGYFDREGFNKKLVEPVYKEMMTAYHKGEQQAVWRFQQDAETKFGMQELPERCRQLIHETAWEDGHAYGLADVAIQYPALVEIAKAAREP